MLFVFRGFTQPMSTLDEFIASLAELSSQVESDFQTLDRELFARASPDECFYGVGDNRNTFVGPGLDCEDCTGDGQAKINQAYVWGMTKTGNNDIWFGTGPNVQCLVIGGILSGFGGIGGDVTTESYVCEFDDSEFPGAFSGTGLGDSRPARIYRYKIRERELVDITPSASPRLNSSLGIRSSGSHNGVVFFAGPGFAGPGVQVVNMFAFDSETGEFLGEQSFPEYINIRKWIVHDGVLYTAVGDNPSGGSVLKWTGDKSDPFQFEKVGDLNGQGAELVFHEGRLYVTTWPGGIGDLTSVGTVFASLYMSPPVPAGGLTGAHSAGWTAVWDVLDYEPDTIIAATYGGGAIESFDGKLYWGTMHVPFSTALGHFSVTPPSDNQDIVEGLLGSFRPISIFRGDNFDAGPGDIELLYGSPLYPAFDTTTKEWNIVPNSAGLLPEYGPPGFGNPFNNYTWTMGVYEDELYVGTMDFSYLLFGNLDISLPMDLPPVICDILGLDDDECMMVEKAYSSFSALFDIRNYLGADLWKFPDGDSPAVPESISGVGNNASYGIRTMVADDDGLFLGMANPMNLLACEDYSQKALNNGPGGWHLLCLTSQYHATIPTLGQWGIILLSVLILILGALSLRSTMSKRFGQQLK